MKLSKVLVCLFISIVINAGIATALCFMDYNMKQNTEDFWPIILMGYLQTMLTFGLSIAIVTKERKKWESVYLRKAVIIALAAVIVTYYGVTICAIMQSNVWVLFVILYLFILIWLYFAEKRIKKHSDK